jgi:hypothetical protein
MFLDTEIASGMVFFVVMFIFALYEKSIEYSADRAGSGGKRNKNEADGNRGGKSHEGIKIAGIEFTGLKDKVRRKVKDGLKEIIDDEIERRL